MRSQLLGQASRVGHLAGLGGGVDRALGIALEGGNRTDRDDAAVFVFHHPPGDLAADQDRRQQVAVQDRLDVLLLDHHRVIGVGFSAGRSDVAAGIVDQDVNRPQALGHLVNDPCDRLTVGQVGQHTQRLDITMFADFPSGVRECCALAVLAGSLFTHPVNTHLGPGGSQVFGECSSQPSSSTCNQGHLALEKSCHRRSRCDRDWCQ